MRRVNDPRNRRAQEWSSAADTAGNLQLLASARSYDARDSTSAPRHRRASSDAPRRYGRADADRATYSGALDARLYPPSNGDTVPQGVTRLLHRRVLHGDP